MRGKITLGADLRYLDMVEGDLSYREMTEMMIARERAMEKKLNEWVTNGSESDRNLFAIWRRPSALISYFSTAS